MSRLREQKLLGLIELLWRELTPTRQNELRPELVDMEWALPERRKPAMDDVFTEHELAAILGMTVAGIRNWRYQKDGPGLVMVDGRYRWADVELFLFRRHKGRNAA